MDISESSAFPETWQKPLLSSFVNTVLSKDDLKNITLCDVIFRPYDPTDVFEAKSCHDEWFPIKYHDDFFLRLEKQHFRTIVAAIPINKLPDNVSHMAYTQGRNDILVGMVVYSHNGSYINPTYLDRVRGYFNTNTDDVGYIYTFGVCQQFNRKGVGRALLDRAVMDLEASFPLTKALALHVVRYNKPAWRLYEACGFTNLGIIENYYSIGDEPYDGVLLARYLKGNRPPWEWRLTNWVGSFFGSSD
eukprot:GDKJ01053027.1.p1 GENE.GDKJ01053027.1~~GDKJ01053027.1.p1  ORF type:complete len:247 (+),score=28.09 GDKJ01053027.1:63-803(+)